MSLVSLIFHQGQNPGELVSKLPNRKIVLVKRGVPLPQGFGPGVAWVCEVEQRDRVALAIPLQLASTWPRIPAQEPGPFFTQNHRLPSGKLVADPAVEGLSPKDDPVATACANRLRAAYDQEEEGVLYNALCGEFGEPISEPTPLEHGEFLLEWNTPWGSLALRDGSYKVLSWSWTGIMEEREEIRAERRFSVLFGEQQCVQFPRIKKVIRAVEGGPDWHWSWSTSTGGRIHRDKPWTPVPGAPEPARVWCDLRLPNPGTYGLEVLDPLIRLLQVDLDASREPSVSGSGRAYSTRDDDRMSGIGEPVFSCALEIDGLRCSTERVYRSWTRGEWPDEVVVLFALDLVVETFPNGWETWEAMTPPAQERLCERIRSALPMVHLEWPSLEGRIEVRWASALPSSGPVYYWREGRLTACRRASDASGRDFESHLGKPRQVPPQIAKRLIEERIAFLEGEIAINAKSRSQKVRDAAENDKKVVQMWRERLATLPE